MEFALRLAVEGQEVADTHWIQRGQVRLVSARAFKFYLVQLASESKNVLDSEKPQPERGFESLVPNHACVIAPAGSVSRSLRLWLRLTEVPLHLSSPSLMSAMHHDWHHRITVAPASPSTWSDIDRLSALPRRPKGSRARLSEPPSLAAQTVAIMMMIMMARAAERPTPK